MLRALDERIPKAANATDTVMRNLHPSSVTAHYMAQEKLNGVYVLWDGANMWTKTGHRIDAPAPFRHALPPAFPLVGELFFGYGHKPFQFASIVSQNKRPGKRTLAAGSSEASGSLVWMHARLVVTVGHRGVPLCPRRSTLPWSPTFRTKNGTNCYGKWLPRGVERSQRPTCHT